MRGIYLSLQSVICLYTKKIKIKDYIFFILYYLGIRRSLESKLVKVVETCNTPGSLDSQGFEANLNEFRFELRLLRFVVENDAES